MGRTGGGVSRAAVRVLAGWCLLCVLAGIVTIASHRSTPPSPVRTAGAPQHVVVARPPATDTTSTTTTTAPPAPPESGAGDATSAGTDTPPSAGDHPPDPGGAGIGSVLDLHAGSVESSAPASCDPNGQMTTTQPLMVFDVAQRCVRSLVLRGQHVEGDVTWSPDGSWLLTVLDGDVVRIASDGSWRQDLGGGGQAQAASLSPDGSRIAVVGNVPCCNGNEKRVVEVAASDGTGGQEVQDDIGLLVQPPVWSRDSQHLAYVAQPPAGTFDDPTYLHVASRDGTMTATRSLDGRGGTQTNTGAQTAALIGRPEWLADGGIAAPVDIEKPTWETLHWFDAALNDRAGPTHPTQMALAPVHATGSGDLLYSAYDPDRGNAVSQVWFLDTAGNAHQLANDAASPAWAPDGDHFVYGGLTWPSNGQGPYPDSLVVADRAGKADTLWTTNDVGCYCWLDHAPVWSPDGSHLAVGTH